jgi:3'-phosphoadenosine 5'-phosphosulfate sulfotransferase (PAPS reductase)/FAD synthetase
MRRAAAAEIATLIPILPKEVNDWCSTQYEIDSLNRFRRLVQLNEDWFTGSRVFDLIARNEHFRAVTTLSGRSFREARSACGII